MTPEWLEYTDGLVAETACIWEATARKVGNVHRYADFGNTTYLDFILSACAIHNCVDCASRRGIGVTILMAVDNTRRLVKANTNLGMILLIVPLSLSSEWSRHLLFELSPEPPPPFNWRIQLADVLNSISATNTRLVYQAIRVANPGGLGDAPEQDVRDEPTVTLLEAMRLAADRDMVARQYANGFADVFDFGVPAFLAGYERFGCVEAAIIDSQLHWLAEYPDSLIVRKNGTAVAADVQKRAAEVFKLGGIATPEGRRAGVELDRHLRSDGNRLNPGTTADLITACLFVALRENKVSPSAPFRWDVPDWL
jgi:triphosphoribosyl-dephospho-CoA synthase